MLAVRDFSMKRVQLLHDVLGGGQGEAGDRALHQRGPARLHLGQVDI